MSETVKQIMEKFEADFSAQFKELKSRYKATVGTYPSRMSYDQFGAETFPFFCAITAAKNALNKLDRTDPEVTSALEDLAKRYVEVQEFGYSTQVDKLLNSDIGSGQTRYTRADLEHTVRGHDCSFEPVGDGLYRLYCNTCDTFPSPSHKGPKPPVRPASQNPYFASR